MIHNQPVKLEQKPLDVLLYLLKHPLETISKEELLGALWKHTTERSLTTAISKLRKAFGGDREAIILTVSNVGYRLAVKAYCTLEQEIPSNRFSLEPGQVLPMRPEWKALRLLSNDERSPVWLAENDGMLRVFKFAMDGVYLQALQREVMIFRFLEKALGTTPPWAIRILSKGFVEEPFFIESEFGGVDLVEWSLSEDYRRHSLSELIQISAELANAVAAAHAIGIHHNDLKPGNVLVQYNLSGSITGAKSPTLPSIRIVDFGIASFLDVHRLRELDITEHGTAGNPDRPPPVGTAIYMAPEVREGRVPTALADIYALGIITYQIISGNFNQTLSPGWEAYISDPLLRTDIAATAEINPQLRLSSAEELAGRLRNLESRRDQQGQLELMQRQAKRNEEATERARLRRPWILFASAVLLIGLCVSLTLLGFTVHQKNLVDKRNAELSAMYEFLATDLMGQSDPYANSPGITHAPQESLLDAIRSALPKIDERFFNSPVVAGRLHSTIADAFKGRTQYVEADREYQKAEQRFKAAEGDLSEDLITTALKRENAQLGSRLPGAVETAEKDFVLQQASILQMKDPGATLLAWQSLIHASILGFGPRPQDAIPVLTQAIAKAQSTPGFDTALLLLMKARICGLYVRLQDGPHLEQFARELRTELAHISGPDNPTLCILDIYIQEALYLEGRYREAIAQGEQNYVRFSRILGPDHELTLATLANRAAAEGELGLYQAASRDDLQLYSAEQSNPSGKRLKEGSLADAAMFECHAGQFEAGVQHARQVIRETKEGPDAQPMFAQGATFTLAECLVARQEQTPSVRKKVELAEAVKLIGSFDPQATDLVSGGTDYPTWLNVIKARLALMNNDREAAQSYASKARSPLAKSDASFYERQVLARIDRSLQLTPSPAKHHINQ